MPSGRPPKHPWDTLALGETFTIPVTEHRGFGRVQMYTYQRNFHLKPKRFSAFHNLDGSVTITRRA